MCDLLSLSYGIPSITEVPWVTGLLFWDIDSKRKILEFLQDQKSYFLYFLVDQNTGTFIAQDDFDTSPISPG